MRPPRQPRPTVSARRPPPATLSRAETLAVTRGRGRSQLAERRRQARRLPGRVEAAGVWQDPEARVGQQVGLEADVRLRFGEGGAVSGDTEDRYIARAAGGDQGLQALAAFPQLGGG